MLQIDSSEVHNWLYLTCRGFSLFHTNVPVTIDSTSCNHIPRVNLTGFKKVSETSERKKKNPHPHHQPHSKFFFVASPTFDDDPDGKKRKAHSVIPMTYSCYRVAFAPAASSCSSQTRGVRATHKSFLWQGKIPRAKEWPTPSKLSLQTRTFTPEAKSPRVKSSL